MKCFQIACWALNDITAVVYYTMYKVSVEMKEKAKTHLEPCTDMEFA